MPVPSSPPPRPGGVLSPVLTPFEADRTPSVPRFIEHCRTLLNHDVGLAVFGTNSEAASLSVAEKRGLLDVLLDAGMPPSRMMPGVGACALGDAVELARHAVAAGCSGVLMLPPFYYKGVSDEGLFRAFSEVVEAVGDARLRIYLYHIPPVAQVGISLGLIGRLLKRYPGVIAGIKDSSGDWRNTAAMLSEFRGAGFDVFAGSETSLVETMRHGGAGVISATANVNPAAIAALCREWDAPDAQARQEELNQVRAAFAGFPMIAAMKAAMSSGLDDAAWNNLRAPLVELDRIQRESLLRSLEALGFELYRGRARESAD
ncbi:dihydrodipicolinate synthase family protein [Herbaspirillum robiniae]|uniref:dihydrodipicolinate synthase family protein n=1 Tax=Herbaspirillum robiniae TaxID=2014887 RepID=UPI003D784424